MKFYSEFEGVLMKFQTNVKDFVFARDVQKKDLMEQVIKSSVLSQIPPPGLAPPGLAPSGSYT